MSDKDFRESSRTGSDAVHDAVLIGGGIMSATLGALLTRVEPNASIVLLERLDAVGAESSAPWNNAGTGHSGYAELNYMPDPDDASTADDIARRFAASRRFWSRLTADGILPTTAVTPVPHLDLVFGTAGVDYLRRRVATLTSIPRFADMEYTEDTDVIRQWAPLLIEDRADAGPVAASRHRGGTDVDFGAITRGLIDDLTARGADVRLRHEVTGLQRRDDGLWAVTGRDRATRARFELTTRFVFVGAGGHALTLLQKARIPEIRGYGVFPIGAQFFRTDDPAIVARHNAKVYGQADIGAPPMSVPHLDRREIDGESSLLFGPFATFDTRLLKAGRYRDLFATVRLHNLVVSASAGLRNLSLLRYLLGQLAMSRRRKFRRLQQFVPGASAESWRLVGAGVRAQLITPDRRGFGVLRFGTEVVTGADGTIAGLLGASPGASTAPSAMVDVLSRCFPDRIEAWRETLREWVPDSEAPRTAASPTPTAERVVHPID